MKVGILCHSSVGGSAHAAVALACELSRRGHSVHIFARHVPPHLTVDERGPAIHSLRSVAKLSPTLDLDWTEADRDALAQRLVSVARTHRLDVLHFHYAVPFADVAERARELLGSDAPILVGTLHGTDVSVNAPPGLREQLDCLDALTTVSHSHAELAHRTLGLGQRPVMIPNAIDLTRFRRRPGRPRPFWPRILHVSNFRAVKDPVRTAEAFVAVRRQHEAELWLVGDGEEMPRVRAILEAAGVIGDTRTLGLRTDVEAIYPLVDAVLLTSLRESFSLVALEAAACGVPVVAPRLGGIPEVVCHGHTGVLYDPEDQTEPARSLAALLEHPERMQAMGDAAARHACQFSLPLIAAEYESLYGAVLARAPRGSLAA